MSELLKPREIIDRKAAALELNRIAEDKDLSSTQQRAAVLSLMKNLHRRGSAIIRTRFETSSDGAAALVAICHLTDQIIRLIHNFATSHAYPLNNPMRTDRLSLVAVGGYGRGDMAPQSDVDILFLYPYKQTGRHEQVVEYLLYMLWDLGLKVGHATRSIDDCIRMAKRDVTIRTNLLENRYIWGDRALFKQLQTRFLSDVVSGTGQAFIEAKLIERDNRHARMGDSRYVVEPNLKDGKGGLRDLHTLHWIGKYLYQVSKTEDLVTHGMLNKTEAKGFEKAQSFFWTVRCWLHYLTGHAEERLTFDLQRDIAERLGYTDRAGASGVERFMKHYYLHAKHVGDLTRIFCAALEANHQRHRLLPLPRLGLGRKAPPGYRLIDNRLAFEAGTRLADAPIRILDLFATAHKNGLDTHPGSLRLITRNLGLINQDMQDDPAANRLFMDMLTAKQAPDIVLRQLNEAGVFGRFIPDFGRVVAQMQYDMYHIYTVDEHTIRAIGILNQIERGDLADEVPLASAVVHKVNSRDVLYTAVLLHDIAKGRGGDHSILGAEVARKLCPRLGLDTAETETVAWLVEAHLTMSLTAFKRDLTDPKTISDFANLVQSPERLRLLLVLTVVDIRAVGPNVWNQWKAVLLRELYDNTADLLTGGHESENLNSRVAAAKAQLRAQLAGWSAQTVTSLIERHYPSYWLNFDVLTHARHADQIRTAERDGGRLSVKSRADPMRSATEITVYTHDHPGLFSQIAGAMALAGASIVDAKIQTMTDGMALDVFWIQDDHGAPFDQQSKLARLSSFIQQIISGQLRPLTELQRQRQNGFRSRLDVFTVAPQIIIDNKASCSHTVIEVTARDRRALLHDITDELRKLSLQISSARIATYGANAVDVFYVKDVFGLQVGSKSKLAKIRTALLTRLTAEEDALRAD